MRRITLVTLTVMTLGLATAACSAGAETTSPWWAVTSNARPTNLSGAPGSTETQELTINGTAGNVALLEPKRLQELESGRRSFSEQLVAVIPFNATAAEVQEGIEASVYPGRQVQVTQVSSKEEEEKGTRRYTISFPHQSGGVFPEPVLAISANGEFPAAFGKPPLTTNEGKEPGQATDVELQQGTATEDEIVVTAENRGDANTTGAVTVADSLPPGLEAVAIAGVAGEIGTHNRGDVSCNLKTLTCTFCTQNSLNCPAAEPPTETGECKRVEQAVPCPSLHAYEEIEVRIAVVPKPEATSGALNTATVSGGGAAHPATATHPITIGGPERFGFDDFQFTPENAGGTVDTQAGSHPFQVTNVVTLNTKRPDSNMNPRAVSLPKEIIGELPAGFVGNPSPFEKCTDAQFATQAPEGSTHDITNECPATSAVGVATITYTNPTGPYSTATAPIFNMVPLPGEPARFAFKALGIVSAFLDAKVRTGSDYGVTVTSSNITQLVSLIGAKLTFWGVPGAPAHDGQRGWQCLEGFGTCSPSTSTTPPPFLVMPTSCQSPFTSTLRGEGWAASGNPPAIAETLTYTPAEAIDGCNHLAFSPTVEVKPDGTAASTPTGLKTIVHVPQNGSINPEGLAESSVRDITVALPEGVTLNPAGADGLDSCSQAEIGFLGEQPGEPDTKLFTNGLPAVKGEAPRPFCSNAAKVATVSIETPLLPHALEGAVYLATPAPSGELGKNPFNSLVAMYIVAEDPVSGTLVKLPGSVSLNQSTGQVTASFKNSPQLPFENAELHFFGGERAPLATPAHCGTYTTHASFTPWSGNEDATSSATFNITTGPNGSPCPGAALPFSPSFTAGNTNIQAGAFSPFTMTMSREDGQQNLKSIQLHMPPGLSGVLTGIPLCAEAQANTGTCPAQSLVGETTVSVGLGGSPFTVTGGQVFLTGPYKEAPFGLSIVNPAKAGPFDLGKVIVRAMLQVDPHTTAVTVTSDSTGPYAIPPSIDGIPLQIKHVNVTINRPGGFTFNPTNCNPQEISGALQSIEGAAATLNVPFQATNCATLGFAPKFAVATSGKNSKANGASLTVKLTYPKAPFGSQANITRVKVSLPRQLPSRLTTLQKACTSAQFQADPEGCPAASRIGHARAITPLIPVPLEGPAYFVSHGGEAFPDLVLVLKGYGVTLDLVGTTFINKAGITSSTFKTVPDAPVGSFELTLPQGRYSALAANGNLCTSKLQMPTEFLAQNGLKINQNTPIAVTGCAKHRALTRAQKLARALKACSRKAKSKRAGCVKQARRTYGPLRRKR